MHTNFNFSFYYPVMQAATHEGRLRYTHVIDLLISGKGSKTHHAQSDAPPTFAFEIEEVEAENQNILPLLEKAKGLDGIKAACSHHIRHISFRQRADFRMSYLPLKKAI